MPALRQQGLSEVAPELVGASPRKPTDVALPHLSPSLSLSRLMKSGFPLRARASVRLEPQTAPCSKIHETSRLIGSESEQM